MQAMSIDHRTQCPCARVNAASGPFGGEGGRRTPSQILALRVYNMPTVSTISKPRLVGAPNVYRPQNTMPVCTGERCQRTVWWGRGPKGAKYWHFASTTCTRCLQLAGRVYCGKAVSTDYKTPCPCARVNAASGPFGGEEGLRPPSQILALRVYNMPTVATINRPRLLGAASDYRPQNTMPVCAGERCQRTIWWGILALRIYNMHTVSTISRPHQLGAGSVYRPQNTMPVRTGER